MYRGIVENNIDPNGSKRVQVRVFGVHTQDSSKVPTEALPWAEVCGDTNFGLIGGVGLSSVLKVGTWVFVAFEDELLERPIIMGVVAGINSDGTPDLYQDVYDDPDNIIALQTKSGHLIKISDVSGSEEISITHKTGTKIIMDASGAMQIETANNLDVTSHGLATFQSEGDLRLFSKNNVMIQGSSVQLNSGVGFSLPELEEPPYPHEFETVEFTPPENYNVDNPDAPINPENNEDVEIADVTDLSNTDEQMNIYELALENISLGENAWTEFNGSSKASSNPNIIALWEEMGIPVQSDSTAWCAVYLGATLKRSGNVALVTAQARQYLNYPGKEIALEDIEAGDICIFWRGSYYDTVHGHVAIYTGKPITNGRIECIGGNQGTPGRLKVSNFGINADNKSASYGLLKIMRPCNASGVDQPKYE